MRINPLTAIDFYKADHRRQYPDGTEYVYSNFTPRSSRHAPVLDDFEGKVVCFGIQGFIKDFLIDTWNENFFNRPKDVVVAEYKRRMDSSLGVGAVPVQHIAELHDLGYLPLRIKALPEGSRVPIRVAMLTVINTDPRFYWLTNYLETCMSAELWKSCATATIAYEYRRILNHYTEVTGSDPGFIPVQAHDFSFRGMSGIHDAAQSGVGHLTSFIGTDTVIAIDYAEQFYNATGLIGVSVPATEHSVMCMGTKDDEIGTFRRLITELYPSGIVSIVADTWDFWQVITEFALELKQEILARTPNESGLCKVVFRPDSGDPVKIICGDPDAATGSPAFKGAVECLYDIFGGEVTAKGYKMLNGKVGLIYGDSITLARARDILSRLEAKGFAAGNIVLGVGSYTYQFLTRDSFGFAMKATWGQVNGEARSIFKDPVTDDGQKKSAKGLLRIERDANNNLVMLDEQTPEQEEGGELKTIFENGKLLVETTLDEVRARLASGG
jgi:nicotinamide phosphoribosyltransferase